MGYSFCFCYFGENFTFYLFFTIKRSISFVEKIRNDFISQRMKKSWQDANIFFLKIFPGFSKQVFINSWLFLLNVYLISDCVT